MTTVTDPISRLTRTPLLTREEEVELARRYHRGDQRAKDRMIEANMRLVVNIASSYLNHGIELEDLVQEGVFGLIRAAEKYDPERGFRFSTYASFWVTQNVQRAVTRQEFEIRVPADVAARRRQVDAARAGKPDATDEQLAESIGCTMSQFRTATTVPAVTTSLDKPRLEDRTLGDVIPDSRPAAEQEIDAQERARGLEDRPLDEPFTLLFGDPAIQVALAGLPALWRRVIELRFGFDGEPRSQDAVGELFGWTGQWVAELERKALMKLREIIGVDE